VRERVRPTREPQQGRAKPTTGETKARGLAVLNSPQLNKGTAFTAEERKDLGLTGLLPAEFSDLSTQVNRAWRQYEALPDDVSKKLYLTSLHDGNEMLFFRLLGEHLPEMIPVMSGAAGRQPSQIFQNDLHQPRGVYLSINQPEAIEQAFLNFDPGGDGVDVIMATDGERVQGLGDAGIGGMEAAIGKLAIYSAAAGIDPARAIPVMLDVGTDRQSLLDDPRYSGNRHTRVRGERYDAFMENYVSVASNLFPRAVLQWVGLETGNARRILDRYRDKVPTFNQELQGTGGIALAAAISAVRVCGIPLRQHRIAIYGAGMAGIAIADQLRDAMARDGISRAEAHSRFWCLDTKGLLTSGMESRLHDYQRPYARSENECKGWKCGPEGQGYSLAEVVRRVKPTMLIGASECTGIISEPIVRLMAQQTPRPVIFTFSTPATQTEASPADLIAWTDGRALVASGAAFAPVTRKGVTYVIAHANPARLYPGICLGAVTSQAAMISSGMIFAAASALSSMVVVRQPGASLLPHIDDLRSVAVTVAAAVAEAAQLEGLARVHLRDVVQEVKDAMWQPEYRRLLAS
jgi:malate dehydrogenase (oxaloacetate-decarboxylating)